LRKFKGRSVEFPPRNSVENYCVAAHPLSNPDFCPIKRGQLYLWHALYVWRDVRCRCELLRGISRIAIPRRRKKHGAASLRRRIATRFGVGQRQSERIQHAACTLEALKLRLFPKKYIGHEFKMA
jgi:hypothetical protein